MIEKQVLLAQARRVYTDLVRGRSTVRVVSASEHTTQIKLAFVLGNYRSGTTALRYSLSSHPEIASPPETDFLEPLLSVTKDERSMRGLGEMGFEEKLVHERIRLFTDFFYANYADSLNATICVDKTPRYTFTAPVILNVFPKSLAIALFRNPFGQTRSLTDGFRFVPDVPHLNPTPEDTPATAASRYWLDGTKHLIEVCQKNEDRVLPVPYEGLCRDPELWLREILSHLGAEWTPAVLSYDPSTVDAGVEGGKAAAHRGFVNRPTDLSGWSESDIEVVQLKTSGLAQSIGYDLGELREVTPSEFRKRVSQADAGEQ